MFSLFRAFAILKPRKAVARFCEKESNRVCCISSFFVACAADI
jgi:hypothetical protein